MKVVKPNKPVASVKLSTDPVVRFLRAGRNISVMSQPKFTEQDFILVDLMGGGFVHSGSFKNQNYKPQCYWKLDYECVLHTEYKHPVEGIIDEETRKVLLQDHDKVEVYELGYFHPVLCEAGQFNRELITGIMRDFVVKHKDKAWILGSVKMTPLNHSQMTEYVTQRRVRRSSFDIPVSSVWGDLEYIYEEHEAVTITAEEYHEHFNTCAGSVAV